MGLGGLYQLRKLYFELDESQLLYGVGVKFYESFGFDFEQMGFPLIFSIFVVMLFLLFGALLPDIDSPESILGRYVPFMGSIVGHRELTHTLWILIGLFTLSYFTSYTFVWMIAFGYLFHMIQDTPSIQGVDWFWPIGKGYRHYGQAKIKNGHKGIYRVGGTVEKVFVYIMYGVNIWLIYLWVILAFAW